MTPLERLRLLLELERKNGATFENAWKFATSKVALDQAHPGWWLEVFEWGRDSWERAYEGRRRLTIDHLAPIGAPEGVALDARDRVTVLA